MNAQSIAQVASFLNVSPNQIKRCEEWATVLFVQVYGSRPRFVSRKVVKTMSEDELMEQMMNEYLESCEDQDNWVDQVDAMMAHLDECLPVTANPTENVLRRVSADVVDGKISEQEAIERLTKKIIIKKK